MLFNELVQKYIAYDTFDATTDDAYYIIDLGEIVKAHNRWNTCLPAVKPYYAMKCNPNPIIIELLSELGLSFDCASKTEIQHILDVTGGDASRIIFAHPCKYVSHLVYARDHNVNMMTFDCEEELYKISNNHCNANILLRLAVDDSHSLCKFNIKFGCPPENVRKLIKVASDLNLNLVGFSFHVGSGCKSADTYYDALRLCRNAMTVSQEYGYNISIIDIGGGFVAHNDDKSDISFEDTADKINEGIIDYFGEETGISFIAEPGRFFVQKSHTLVVCIIGKKKSSDGFIYYINDGIYGSFNCIIFDHQEPEFELVNKAKDIKKLYKSQIFGNTCDSLDEIKKCTLLPELDVGDYLYVKNFGAYTTSARSDGFNGYKVTDHRYTFTS
jgi:diaminopimelate decarboxylase